MISKFLKFFFSFILLFVLSFGVYFCFQHVYKKNTNKGTSHIKGAYDKAENVILKQYVNSCYELRDAAKLFYTESYLNGEVSSGSVINLQIYGKKPTSGTWYIDSKGNVILKDVIYDSYICNTVMDDTNNIMDCKKQDK